MRGLLWTLSILFLISLAANVFFISGRGIHVTNRYEQHQNQQQAQLVLGLCSSQGHIEWREGRSDDLTSLLNTLSPEQALFAKVVRPNLVVYPDFQAKEVPTQEAASTSTMSGQRLLSR